MAACGRVMQNPEMKLDARVVFGVTYCRDQRDQLPRAPTPMFWH
jgi:hypothetical protein